MGENGVCPCELFMEYEGMGRTNVGKGYAQMLLREKRDVKVMAKEVCTNAAICARYSDCAAPMVEDH